MSSHSSSHQDEHQQQWLVRFQNETHVIESDNFLSKLSNETGWPCQYLQVTNQAYPFVQVRLVSSLRGGKGGFGTLLKGQSKQAGAKMTTDFGACRDLQGRRLRHVNDEIKLRKWKEIQRKKQAGQEVNEDAEYMNTASGLYNWHLMTPNWASISNKAKNKLQRETKRQFDMLATEQEKRRAAWEEKDRLHKQAVQAYVQQSVSATENLEVNDAIQQGLLAAKRKRQEGAAVAAITDDEDNLQQQSLVTLSGDFVMEEDAINGWSVQSKSDFATLALVLDRKPSLSLYYEVQLESGGLAQIGWADLREFRPNTESGDGVGDDNASFAYDGSRSLVFHGGNEEKYGSNEWMAGDVVGCRYDPPSGVVSYSVNGKSLGVAFTTVPERPLVPALSCNQGEILQLHIQQSQMKHMPKTGCVSIHEVMEKEEATRSREHDDKTLVPSEKEGDNIKSTDPVPSPDTKPPAKKKNKPAPLHPEPLDLGKYESAEQLSELGMDRLKSALMAVGAKCGGSLEERAARLFSLKGLERKDYPVKLRARNFVL